MKVEKIQKFEPFSINILIESEEESNDLKQELVNALSDAFENSTTIKILTKILEKL